MSILEIQRNIIPNVIKYRNEGLFGIIFLYFSINLLNDSHFCLLAEIHNPFVDSFKYIEVLRGVARFSVRNSIRYLYRIPSLINTDWQRRGSFITIC